MNFKVFLLILGLVAASDKPTTQSAADRVPKSWNVQEIGRNALMDSERDKIRNDQLQTTLLAWEIEEDNRPLYVETCIVSMNFRAPDGKTQWRLAHLYHHPKERKPDPKWTLATVMDAPFEYLKDFDHPPKNEEVYAFLKATWWYFKPDDGFHLLDAAVCSQSWRELTGELPTKLFETWSGIGTTSSSSSTGSNGLKR